MLAALIACLLQIGPTPGGPGAPPGSGEDAFNLGLLGATGVPRPEGAGIRIAEVLPGGPAAAGGLARGDELVAMGGRGFPKKADAVYFLVEALEGVTSGKGGALPVTVRRGGRPEMLKVPLPGLGRHSAECPTGCERCSKAVDESLAWLVSQQRADGSWASGLGGRNGHVAVTALAGMALLAAGSTPAEGPYAANLQRAVDWMIQFGGTEDGSFPKKEGGPNWNQVNWSLGYAGAFLGVVHQRAPDSRIAAKLSALAAAILQNQEATGGWAHGPGGPNALNYLELEIMTNYCLLALGLARQAGVEVPQTGVDKALAYLDQCTSGGGVSYSPRPGQKGNGDPGRTAGAVVALQALDLERHPRYAPMLKFAVRGFERLYEGHVSPVMHFLAGGMASHQGGAEPWRAFQGAFRLEFLAARRPDGAFAARPTAESKQLHNNTDRAVGAVWTTASYLIIQQLPRGNLKW